MPANRTAALQSFTRFTLERGVIISVSMLDRLCKRVEFLRACAYLNNIKAEIPKTRGQTGRYRVSFPHIGQNESGYVPSVTGSSLPQLSQFRMPPRSRLKRF